MQHTDDTHSDCSGFGPPMFTLVDAGPEADDALIRCDARTSDTVEFDPRMRELIENAQCAVEAARPMIELAILERVASLIEEFKALNDDARLTRDWNLGWSDAIRVTQDALQREVESARARLVEPRDTLTS